MLQVACKITVLVALIVGSRPIDRQSSTSPPQPSVFRIGVDVVALNVTVTDPSHRFVADLGESDFLVFEDGRRQEVTFFQRTGLPLALVLLLDTSASMQDSLAVAQDAAVGFARELGPEDRASVIEFDSTVRILQSFTNDRAAIERAIRQTEPNGSTTLYNALYIALKELNKTRAGPHGDPLRRAIVVLSDGDDTSSLVGFEEVLDLAARGDTAIYAIGLGIRTSPAARTSADAQFILKRLADQTGGRTFFPQAARDLASVYGEIKAELSSQYSLAYESSNARRDGRFRRVAVRVEREGVVARTRPGYYAAAQ